MKDCTLIIPYYRNPLMLRRQLLELDMYPAEWRVIIVDDGSPEPAEDVLREWWLPYANHSAQMRLSLYRINVDIPWNREGARNLASQECNTEWMVHVDIDHVLPAECAAALLKHPWEDRAFFRFPRNRVGAADETRKKDRIPTDAPFGAIHPHIDSYLCQKADYWTAGGYNEDFSGILGGGSEFLRRMERTARPRVAPPEIYLNVHTRSSVPDASDLYCSRDMSAVKKLERALREAGSPKPTTWLRFPWYRVL